MRILGVDPALSITGYGVIDFTKNKLVLLEAGIIKTSAKDPLAVRLKDIYLGLNSLIQDVKPQVMVLEKIFAHYHHPATSYL